MVKFNDVFEKKIDEAESKLRTVARFQSHPESFNHSVEALQLAVTELLSAVKLLGYVASNFDLELTENDLENID